MPSRRTSTAHIDNSDKTDATESIVKISWDGSLTTKRKWFENLPKWLAKENDHYKHF